MKGGTKHANALPLCRKVTASQQDVTLHHIFNVKRNGAICNLTKREFFLRLVVVERCSCSKDELTSLEDLQIRSASHEEIIWIVVVS
jgi:hypothetical protein